MPCRRAKSRIRAPGTEHSSTTRARNSASCARRRSPTISIRTSEAATVAATVDNMLPFSMQPSRPNQSHSRKAATSPRLRSSAARQRCQVPPRRAREGPAPGAPHRPLPHSGCARPPGQPWASPPAREKATGHTPDGLLLQHWSPGVAGRTCWIAMGSVHAPCQGRPAGSAWLTPTAADHGAAAREV